MARQKFDRSLIPPSPNLSFEKELWAGGVELIAGIDEAGRGALAGPVTAAAVILPFETPDLRKRLPGVQDSKAMSAGARAYWREEIQKTALDYSVGFATHTEIDAYGIIPATHLAVRRAVLALRLFPDHLLVDALHLHDFPIPHTALIKGDARSLSIAAASILAKTARDEKMVALAKEYSEYGFSKNKGYGTPAHLSAIARIGPSAHHRKSFAPMRLALQ